MGTVAAPPKPDTEPSALENGVRSAIAGHPRGAVRRIVLWTIVFAAIGVALVLTTSPAESIALVIALAAIALLSLTDQLA